MRETEILRGLGKARSNRFADGMVPAKRPTLGQRVLGKMTGGLVGYDSSNDTKPVATSIALESEGAIGKAARTLRGRAKQIDDTIREAEGYKDGVVPYLDKSGIVHGPGTSTSDSVPAMLSDDEAVLPAKTVEAIGPANLARLIEETNGVAPQRGLGTARYAKGRVPQWTTSLGADGASGNMSASEPAPSIRNKPESLGTRNPNLSAVEPPAANTGRVAYVDDPVERANNYRAQTRAPMPGVVEPVSPASVAAEATPNTVKSGSLKDRALSFVEKLKSGPAAAAPATQVAEVAKVAQPSLGSKALRFAGKAAAYAAPVVGAFEAANDSDENVKAMANSVGLDYNSDAGRMGANTLNFLEKTGNAATFGLAGRLGRKLAGGSFFDAPTAAAAPATTPTSVPAPTAPANTQLTGEIPASEVAATQDNTTAASQPAVSPFREAQDMLRASEFSRGESWQDRADKKALRGRAMDMATIINSDQSQENNRYATDSTFAANANNSQIKLAEFQNTLKQQAGTKVNDLLKGISTETTDKGKTQFSADKYAQNLMSFQTFLAESGLKPTDVDETVFSDFVTAKDAKDLQDADNNTTVMKVGRALGLADAASTSRNPMNPVYQYELDSSGVLGLKAVAKDSKGRTANSIRMNDAVGGNWGTPTNIDQLSFKQRQDRYRRQQRNE